MALRKMSKAEILTRMDSARVRLPLEDFLGLTEGYPTAHGEICRLLWRGRWYLVLAHREAEVGRLFFAWRRPIVQVKADIRHG